MAGLLMRRYVMRRCVERAANRRAAVPCLSTRRASHTRRVGCEATWITLCILLSFAYPIAAAPFEPVAPGVYVRYGVHEDMSVGNGGAVGNVVAIVGEESVAVVDPGGGLAHGEVVIEALSDITRLPVRYLVFTHVHADHVLAATAFDDAIPRVAHARYGEALARRAGFYLERYGDLIGDAAALARLRPTVSVAPGTPQTLDLGGRVLELQAWPVAHTTNDLTVLDRATGTLIAGDLLFATRLPSLDGNLEGWIDVLDTLAQAYDGARRVIPGHGKVGTLAERSRPQRNYLERLATDVGQAIDRGVPLSTVLDMVPVPASPPWTLVDLHHPANVMRAYSELEWR